MKAEAMETSDGAIACRVSCVMTLVTLNLDYREGRLLKMRGTLTWWWGMEVFSGSPFKRGVVHN